MHDVCEVRLRGLGFDLHQQHRTGLCHFPLAHYLSIHYQCLIFSVSIHWPPGPSTICTVHPEGKTRTSDTRIEVRYALQCVAVCCSECSSETNCKSHELSPPTCPTLPPPWARACGGGEFVTFPPPWARMGGKSGHQWDDTPPTLGLGMWGGRVCDPPTCPTLPQPWAALSKSPRLGRYTIHFTNSTRTKLGAVSDTDGSYRLYSLHLGRGCV